MCKSACDICKTYWMHVWDVKVKVSFTMKTDEVKISKRSKLNHADPCKYRSQSWWLPIWTTAHSVDNNLKGQRSNICQEVAIRGTNSVYMNGHFKMARKWIFIMSWHHMNVRLKVVFKNKIDFTVMCCVVFCGKTAQPSEPSPKAREPWANMLAGVMSFNLKYWVALFSRGLNIALRFFQLRHKIIQTVRSPILLNCRWMY